MPTYDYTQSAKECAQLPEEGLGKEWVYDDQGNKKPINHAKREARLPLDYTEDILEREHKTSDYRDNMTLDDIYDNDVSMAKDAIKNARRYKFDNQGQAQAFRGKALLVTMEHCGVTAFPGTPHEILQKKMDEQKLKVENRVGMYEGQDSWKNGNYIYKNGELVAFISLIIYQEPSIIAIDRSPKYWVITNAKVDGKGNW